MVRNPVRKALLERKLTLGTWIQIGHGAVAEILANAGYDWVAADCEHTDIDVALYTDLCRGMFGRGAVPMARCSTQGPWASSSHSSTPPTKPPEPSPPRSSPPWASAGSPSRG